MNVEAIKEHLITWVTEQGGSLAIWGRQNAPSPFNDHFVLFFNNLDQIGEDYEGLPDAQGTYYTRGDREFTLSVQAIGFNAMGRLEKLRTSLQRLPVRDKLALGGIVYVTTNPIQDIAALLGDVYEERASLDVRFRIGIAQNIEDMPIIEIVDFTSSVYTFAEETVTDPATGKLTEKVVEKDVYRENTLIEVIQQQDDLNI